MPNRSTVLLTRESDAPPRDPTLVNVDGACGPEAGPPRMMTSSHPCTLRERNIELWGARGARVSTTLASNATAPVLGTWFGGGGSCHPQSSCASTSTLSHVVAGYSEPCCSWRRRRCFFRWTRSQCCGPRPWHRPRARDEQCKWAGRLNFTRPCR